MNNFQKLWLQDSLNRMAITRAKQAIQQTGRALPCSVVSVSGQIVTVKFEVLSSPWTLPNVSIPIATSKYDWLPVQAGDSGMTVPGDIYLGGISGLGGGVADNRMRGNLSNLVFVPVANASWTNPNGNSGYRTMQGPNGFSLQSTDGSVSIVGDKTGGITLRFGAKTWTFTAAGFTDASGNIEETHVHLYTPGSGTPTDTGPPTG